MVFLAKLYWGLICMHSMMNPFWWMRGCHYTKRREWTSFTEAWTESYPRGSSYYLLYKLWTNLFWPYKRFTTIDTTKFYHQMRRFWSLILKFVDNLIPCSSKVFIDYNYKIQRLLLGYEIMYVGNFIHIIL